MMVQGDMTIISMINVDCSQGDTVSLIMITTPIT